MLGRLNTLCSTNTLPHTLLFSLSVRARVFSFEQQFENPCFPLLVTYKSWRERGLEVIIRRAERTKNGLEGGWVHYFITSNFPPNSRHEKGKASRATESLVL